MSAQTSFWIEEQTDRKTSTAFRPIHYLGSKLRVLDAISRVVDHVDPNGNPLIDLFTGSGTVAAAFANSRTVIAVDIQEYSRVLASAILRPAKLEENTISAVLRNAQESDFGRALTSAMAPLMDYEKECLHQATHGDADGLYDFLEAGSLVAFQSNANGDSTSLRRAHRQTIDGLKQVGLSKSPESLICRYFGGLYFSVEQALQLDLISYALQSESQGMRDTLLAAALSTASDIVNTVGKQFAQPLRPRDASGRAKRHLVAKIIRDRSVRVFSAYQGWLTRYAKLTAIGGSHEIHRDDYRSFLDRSRALPGVVYADPPYTRDHYSRYYHVLETMCLRDNPEISTSMQKGQEALSRGLYRQQRHQSPFCIASQAPHAFKQLFDKARRFGAPLVVSYSPYEEKQRQRPRVLSIDGLFDLARNSYSRVEVVSAGDIVHNKLGWSESTSHERDAEKLLICQV